MEPKKRVSSWAVLLGLMVAIASTQPAAGAIGGAVANTAAAQASSSATEGAFTKLQHIYDCSCVQTYRDGSEASVSSCDDTQTQCADLDLLEGCQEDPVVHPVSRLERVCTRSPASRSFGAARENATHTTTRREP
jgi:hypothetical protein